jgi:hypothetical protein
MLSPTKSQLASNALGRSLVLKDFMSVKLPDEPGDITGNPLRADNR